MVWDINRAQVFLCMTSLNNQPKNSLRSAPLCFPTERIGDGARQKFVQEHSLGDQSRKESVQIASLKNQPLTPLHLSVSQWKELWFVSDENSRDTRVWEIAHTRIRSILQV